MAARYHWFLRERKRRQQILGLIEAVPEAPDYVEPADDDPIASPSGEPDQPLDTPTDSETSEPEPGIDSDFAMPARLEITDASQGVQRTETDPGTWGNAYVAALLTGPEYWEVLIQNSTPRNATIATGVSTLAMPLNGTPGALNGTIAYWSNGEVRQNGAVIATLSTYGRGDRIGISYDTDGGVRLFKNCAPLNGGAAVGTVSGDVYPFVGLYSAESRTLYRFALSKFGCTVPDGFHPIGQVPGPDPIIETFDDPQFFESGSALRTSKTSGQMGASWDMPGTAADQEVLARFVVSQVSGSNRARVYLRGAGSSGTETAYLLEQNNFENDHFNVWKIVNGSFTKLATSTKHEVFSSRRMWFRLRVEGTAIKGRFWMNGDDEPTAWDFDLTDSSITAAGWAGLGSREENCYWDYFAVGNNGASAPALGETPGTDQYATDFSEANANDDWTNRWDATDVTRTVVTTASDIAPLSWQVRWNQRFSNNIDTWRVDESNNLELNSANDARRLLSRHGAHSRNIEILSRLRMPTDFGEREWLVARASGDAGAENGYRLLPTFIDTERLLISKDENGASTIIQEVPQILTTASDVYMRFRVFEHTLKGKYWVFGEPEPSDWTIEATDASIDVDGWAGVGRFASASYGLTIVSSRWRWVTFAFDGETAPFPD